MLRDFPLGETDIRSGHSRHRTDGEQGMALLLALVALSILSLLSLYLSFSAATEVRISDNHEGEVHALTAAKAGIAHARELLRGLRYDDLLAGPDGSYDNSPGYLSLAHTTSFRNPVSWNLARTMQITNPSAALSGLPDDGLFNSGKYGSTSGTILVPLIGLAHTAANPYGSGTIITGRYFLKASDNNGEATELSKDSTDNPFHDGDGIILVRSAGIAGVVVEGTGASSRRNSVAAIEVRFKQSSTFQLDAPLVVQGDSILPSKPNMFDGNSFDIVGGPTNPGMGIIDTNPTNPTLPADQVEAQLAPNQRDNITGMGLTPSVHDITSDVSSDPDKAHLLDPNWLYNFATVTVPQFADSIFTGDQSWSGGSAPDFGTYDFMKQPTDPSQHPRVTYVDGDLQASGNMSGGGLLVIRGKFSGSGHFEFNGLVLIIGEGEVDLSGMNLGIHGGMYVVNVVETNGNVVFGTPKITISGHSVIQVDSESLSMGTRLIPPAQMGWREIRSGMDPP